MRFTPPHPFPRRSLPDLEGTRHSLARFWSEGPALIAVGHGDCPTTRLALPYVDRIHRGRKSGAQAVVVLQDGVEEAQALVAELGLTLPILLEADPYPLAAALELRTVPTLVLVGPEGRITAACEGFRRDDLEGLARALGHARPVFRPGDGAPPQRPG